MARAPTNRLPTSRQIAAFWKWFASVERQVAADPLEPKLNWALERRLEAFDLTWEVGPGETKEHSFVLSPGGDPSLLRVSKALVAGAPDLKDWELHHAKPPKQWDLRFELGVEDGPLARVDARRWTYVLYDFGDKVFDLTFEATNARKLDASLVDHAVEIVLEGVLGEETRMTHIGRADLVPALPKKLARKKSAIKTLRDHLEQRLRRSE